jgi:hypothetical protein
MDRRLDVEVQGDRNWTTVAINSDLIAKARPNGPVSAWRRSIDRSMLAGL